MKIFVFIILILVFCSKTYAFTNVEMGKRGLATATLMFCNMANVSAGNTEQQDTGLCDRWHAFHLILNSLAFISSFITTALLIKWCERSRSQYNNDYRKNEENEENEENEGNEASSILRESII